MSVNVVGEDRLSQGKDSRHSAPHRSSPAFFRGDQVPVRGNFAFPEDESDELQRSVDELAAEVADMKRRISNLETKTTSGNTIDLLGG